MKKIKLTKREAYDLSAVLATSLREKAEEVDFKEIIGVQKVVNAMVAVIKDYSDKFEELNKQRKVFVDNANKKITAFRRDLAKKQGSDGKLSDDYKEKVKEFMEEMMIDATKEIEESVTPEYKVLYDGLGKEAVEIEVEEDKYKMALAIFEKYAKVYYTDKKIMVETYEKFTV